MKKTALLTFKIMTFTKFKNATIKLETLEKEVKVILGS